MRIAVVGAGIAGLVAACAFQRDGHAVTVYERRATPNPDGAGLTLFRNAFEALDMVGLGDAVRAVSSPEIAGMRAGQRLPHGAWLATVPTASISSMRSVHRSELHTALLSELHSGTLRTAAAAQVPANGTPRVTVGSCTERFDLVAVADGIRSRNRATLGLDSGVRYAGCVAWRGVTEQPVALHGAAAETWGRGRIFGLVPLPADRIYWFATLNTSAGTEFADDLAAVRAHFGAWHDPIRACIDATAPDSVLRHDLVDLARPLPTFVRGRTVLLGDAAHAMTPNLGQGAGQAIEDAATLAVLLRGAGLTDLDSVLHRYDALRLPRTRSVQRRSRMLGRIVQLEHPVLTGLRNVALRLTPNHVLGVLSERVQRWPHPPTKAH